MSSPDAHSSSRTPFTAEYDDLPETIRRLYTPKQYAWLTDGQKAGLFDNELEPGYTE